jgi:hypothetical protein
MAVIERRPLRDFRPNNPDEIWVLEWFGGLVNNPDDPSNLLVECVLTPCVEVLGTPESPPRLKRRISAQVVRTIGVCTLAGIELGRRYRDGQLEPVSVAGSSPHELISFRFHPEQAEDTLTSAVGFEPAYAPAGEIPRLGRINGPVKVIKGEVTGSNNPRTPDFEATPSAPRPMTVILHELEVMRFYYVMSQKMAQALFNGWYEDGELHRRVVLSKHEGPHMRLGTGAARLEYRLGFTADDAPIIGRILFDPHALRGARRVGRTLAIDSVLTTTMRGERDGRHYPRTNFPFWHKAQIELAGRRVRLATGEFAFLAYRIISCTSRFPFKSLSYQCEVEPGGVHAPPGAPQAFANRPGKQMPAAGQRGEVVSNERPQANTEPAVSTPERRRILGLDNVELRHEKVRRNTHVAGERMPGRSDPNLQNTSAGAPTSGQSTAQQQQISDEIDAGRPPVDLATFVQVLRLVKTLRPAWALSTLPLGGHWRDQESNVVYSSFPQVQCPKIKSIPRQFSFMDKDKTIRRRLVCAQVQDKGRFVYVLESERRLNSNGQYMEELPMLVVWQRLNRRADPRLLKSVLELTVENPSKTWPQTLTQLQLERDAVEHGKVREVEGLASRLVACINRALAY